MLTDDIAEVLRSHYPNPPATAAELDEFERTHGFKLDPELRAFYAAANGARLFRIEDCPYKILPLREIVMGKEALLPPATSQVCPDNVLAFCYVQDGNYAGFEVTPVGPFPILDLFHETWPEKRTVIAISFGEFLSRALRSEGWLYWLG